MAKRHWSTSAPFTYVWVIENVSELTHLDLESPMFCAPYISQTDWFLRIMDVSNTISWSLSFRMIATEEFHKIRCKFSLVSSDGSLLVSEIFQKDWSWDTDLRKNAFLARFTHNNTLTVQCHIWRKGLKTPNKDLCYAKSRLKTYTKSFLWPIEQFSALKSSSEFSFKERSVDERKIYSLPPFTEKGPSMDLVLYLARNSELGDVYVDFIIEKSRNDAFSCEISVLNSNGEVTASRMETRGQFNGSQILRFWPLISKKKLIVNKNLFLPNDTLLLRCCIEVFSGSLSSEIEYSTPNVFSIVEEDNSDFSYEDDGSADDSEFIHEYDDSEFIHEDSADDSELIHEYDDSADVENDLIHNDVEEKRDSNSCRDSCSFKAALKYLHDETTLSDISLQNGTESYPVHQNILCSRCPVFKNILRNNMTRNIEINDMERSTLCHLLKYIYTDAVEDLRFEVALDLYKAASDYQLLDLKQKCLDFVIMNLCKTNARDVLSVANKYEDEKLERAARDFANDVSKEN